MRPQIFISSSKNILDQSQQPLLCVPKRKNEIPRSLDSLDQLIHEDQQKHIDRVVRSQYILEQPEIELHQNFEAARAINNTELTRNYEYHKIIVKSLTVVIDCVHVFIMPDVCDTEAQRSTIDSIGSGKLQSSEEKMSQEKRKSRQNSIVCNYNVTDFFTIDIQEHQPTNTVPKPILPVWQYRLVTFTDYVEDKLGLGQQLISQQYNI